MTCSSFSQFIIIVGLLKLQYALITAIMYTKEILCCFRQITSGRGTRIQDKEPLDSIRTTVTKD